MKLIVGLGNVGERYRHTRHNAGFEVVDRFAEKFGGSPSWNHSNEWKAETRKSALGATQLLLVKPVTYMNLSGEAVQPIMAYYKIVPEDVLVVYDDMDLPLGHIRLRIRGGSGGHHGIDSILGRVGEMFCRLRVGIGKPVPPIKGEHYVLGTFAPDEQPVMEKAFIQGVDAVGVWVEEGIEAAMNKFNGALPA